MPSLTRKSGLAWLRKAVTLNAMDVYNLNYDTNQVLTIANGNVVGQFQSNHNRFGGRFTKVNFTSELRGFAMASPVVDQPPEIPLFQACGFKLTHTTTGADTYVLELGDLHFTTESPGIVTPIGLERYIDGKKWVATNCVGNVVLNFVGGQIPTADWEFKGNYNAVVAAGTFPNYFPGESPMASSNGSLAVADGSTWNSLVVRSLRLEINNDIPERPDLSGGYGYADFAIVAREPRYTMVVEVPYDITDFNPEDVWEAGDQLTVTFQHGALSAGTGGQIAVEFDAYIDEHPVPSDDNGILVYTIVMKQSVDSGATPLTLTFA